MDWHYARLVRDHIRMPEAEAGAKLGKFKEVLARHDATGPRLIVVIGDGHPERLAAAKLAEQVGHLHGVLMIALPDDSNLFRVTPATIGECVRLIGQAVMCETTLRDLAGKVVQAVFGVGVSFTALFVHREQADMSHTKGRLHHVLVAVIPRFMVWSDHTMERGITALEK